MVNSTKENSVPQDNASNEELNSEIKVSTEELQSNEIETNEKPNYAQNALPTKSLSEIQKMSLDEQLKLYMV